jgi:two-component sensor histidine kinase
MELLPPGGSAVPVEVTGAPVFNDQGEVQYALAVYRNISDRKRAESKEREYYRNLEFLSRTANRFMGLPPEGDIYGSIAAELAGLVEGATAVIASFDSGQNDLIVRAAVGPAGRLKEAGESLGGGLVGKTFRLDAKQASDLLSGRVTLETGGLRSLLAGYMPDETVRRLEGILDAGAVYSTGLATSGRLFGAAFLILKRKAPEEGLEVVQTFISQASVALQRWGAEELVRSSLKEKEILLSEVHHRVKNNLQIVSSLLSLQAQMARDKDAVAVLGEAQNRIRTLALIHERLYASRDMAGVDMADYLGLLVNRLASTYEQPARRVRVRVEVEKLSLDIEAAIPCGLIANELVSNALKHAFPDGREGAVRVRLGKTENGGYRLSVEDNGVGFPEGLDFSKTKTLGCQIVTNLAAQLGGTIGLDRVGGTKIVLQFKGSRRRG